MTSSTPILPIFVVVVDRMSLGMPANTFKMAVYADNESDAVDKVLDALYVHDYAFAGNPEGFNINKAFQLYPYDLFGGPHTHALRDALNLASHVGDTVAVEELTFLSGLVTLVTQELEEPSIMGLPVNPYDAANKFQQLLSKGDQT